MHAGESMNGKHYNLRILPLFEDDLNEILDYISFHLHNPSAADTLIDDVEDAIQKRLLFPDSVEPYPSTREREHLYYTIQVRNYTVFYVVIDDTMEVRRILYSRRNLQNLI